MLMHGGIDLSTGADEFFKDLTKIIKDKPLYKVSGKIPITLEVKYNRILVLSVNRKRESRIGKSKNWSTVSEYYLHYDNKILKDSGGNDIKGYIIEPASYNPNSAGKNLSPEEQQKTAGSDTKIPDGLDKIFWRHSSKAFFVKSTNHNSSSNVINNLYNAISNLYENIDAITCKDLLCKHFSRKNYGFTHIHIMPELYSDDLIVGSEKNCGNREDVLMHYGLSGVWSEGCLLPTDEVNDINFPTMAKNELSTVSAVAKLMYAMITHDIHLISNIYEYT